jgi:hypothetical protein
MSSIINFVQKNKIIVLGIIFSPLIMYLSSILIKVVFNMGTYLGTFVRNIFSLVC